MNAMVCKVIDEEKRPTQFRIDVFRVELLEFGQLLHPSWIIFMPPCLVEELQLVQGRLCVIILAPLDLECEVLFGSLMLYEPHCGEMSPS